MNTPSIVTLEDVLLALGRLSNAGFTPPADVSIRKLVDEWFDIMKRNRVAIIELRDAINDYQDSDRQFWPKPGEILSRIRMKRQTRGLPSAIGLQGEYDTWFRSGCRGPCPVCSATFDVERGGVFHSDRVHRERGVSYSSRRGMT